MKTMIMTTTMRIIKMPKSASTSSKTTSIGTSMHHSIFKRRRIRRSRRGGT